MRVHARVPILRPREELRDWHPAALHHGHVREVAQGGQELLEESEIQYAKLHTPRRHHLGGTLGLKCAMERRPMAWTEKRH